MDNEQNSVVDSKPKEPTRVLITGITGMAGSHLAEYCMSLPNVEVHGAKRWRSDASNISATHFKNVTFHECDIKDQTNVLNMIEKVRPHKIFHLAAQSFVKASWDSPHETMITNAIGQMNVLEAVRKVGIDPVVQICGSSEEYGRVESDECPIKEDQPLRPLSPYGVSKVAQDLMGYQYFKSYGIRVIRTRAFNHEGPRRGDMFVTSTFAKQIALIEAGKQEPVVKVGNLSALRDYTDVRDMVRAYWIATEKCDPGEVYNICSGKTWMISDVLRFYIDRTQMHVSIEEDPDRMRPSDVQILLGDPSKFINKTGWKPEIPFETTLQDTLDYWRARVVIQGGL